MPLAHELKIMCPSCKHRVATIRRLRGGNGEVVYCEGCDSTYTLDEWLAWKAEQNRDRSLLLDTGELG